jgi:hypothetical protein
MKGSNSSQTIQAFGCAPLTNRKSFCRTFAATTGKKGSSGMKREAVLESRVPPEPDRSAALLSDSGIV